jgi:hypothetical protein
MLPDRPAPPPRRRRAAAAARARSWLDRLLAEGDRGDITVRPAAGDTLPAAATDTSSSLADIGEGNKVAPGA